MKEKEEKAESNYETLLQLLKEINKNLRKAREDLEVVQDKILFPVKRYKEREK